ncbi:DUF4439 domain-containing protein [Cellulomonas sp. DKR-3]|uniref:DUF4439 domain-containing protein n=1 Tax=Cellulomonas fulva TaxID=2835530 RepID=A0ABS5U300_9CELL|nr:DUF4439 domain-containing protein [Cellulomonas fulva]MBT0995742.1 DUF4439 domain-containing protein [Cellulomonas fulva]
MSTPDDTPATTRDVAGITPRTGSGTAGGARRRTVQAARRRAGRRTGAALVATAVALVVAGCGLRLETPPPAEPTPDAVEQVRARTVDDALALTDAATSAAATADGSSDDALHTLLEQVATISTEQADALGGVYESGLEPTASPAPTSAGSAVEATPDEVLALLGSTSTTALADADDVADGPLARLVGSVAVSRADLADRLAARLGADSPAPPAADAQEVPDEVPTPVAAPLARAHDEAGFTFELVAARRSDDDRDRSLTAAARDRVLGARWAASAALTDTAQDPRLAAYALPAGLDDDALLERLALSVRTGLADAYAAAVAEVPAGGRAPYLDGLRRSVADARPWGAAPSAFPGLPEQGEAAGS